MNEISAADVRQEQLLRTRSAILIVLLLAVAAATIQRISDHRTRSAVPTRGGGFFEAPVFLDVPSYRQWDPAWGARRMGRTADTLRFSGCAVCCAAMVLSHFGASVDPGELNEFLGRRGGYTSRGWLRWERAMELRPGEVRLAYAGRVDHGRIDANLRRGNPSIVRVFLLGLFGHYVVIVGKRVLDYYVNDPLRPGGKPTPLSKVSGRMSDLRIYELRRPRVGCKNGD